ncbi:protein-L-isoaspartate(D-aspartate) O-methyltransferase [Actinomadura rupiterrae]|uniref:protein-L-isoaspartate(D-aspartate) O-methyltransferase n=1 Tax=Actinomadura rupiterrae TaxID=559627 RepID=UPI0020A26F6C|nr:protein-L-isoaspartate(D-aspartate) O-methyltransferase [Actinomadura rupiterrae]MCP2336716.1 protein-L-isoaspartate(D-aspartate) O-methyltransferase [Actinomadura rupiterrae]
MTQAEGFESLIDRMAGLGEEWRGAARAVPRHLFVPDQAWCLPEEGDGYLIDRAADCDKWVHSAYSDSAIITQFADGSASVASGPGEFTSSLSAPGIVFSFLELLDPYDGDEVLEIGTGTGWTAGLLASRLGDDNVYSIEIDEALHVVAGANLLAAGRTPHLIHADGAKGWAEGAPYDRVHVTVGVRDVPHAWVEQTRPGGLVVFPWMPGWEPGHCVRLTVGEGGTAVGRFHGGCGFVMLRSQRPPAAPAGGESRKSFTALDPRRVVRASTGADVAIAGLVPDLFGNHQTEDDGSFDLWLWSSDSSAHVHYDPGYKDSAVRQSGRRALWDEVHDAFLHWVALGSPTRDRFGLSVTPHGQHVWLDSPRTPLRA